MPIQECAVCKMTKQTQFLYGVDSCNTCSMKHRSHCKKSEPKRDPGTYIDDPDCPFCNFKKYILVQQTVSIPSAHMMAQINALTHLLGEISNMDNHREKTFRTMFFKTNYSTDDAIFTRSIKFTEKPRNKVMNFEEWTAMNQITIIDFFKNINFIKNFTSDDRKKFIRGMRFRSGIFSTAFRSFKSEKSELVLIDNVDIFPDLTGHCHTPDLLNQIRRELISKIKELNITRDEFLLLLMLHLFVYEVKNISPAGAAILNEQRNIYGAALLQHCVLQNSRTGSSRFQNLISVCAATDKTYHDIESFAILFRIKDPNRKGNDLIRFE